MWWADVGMGVVGVGVVAFGGGVVGSRGDSRWWVWVWRVVGVGGW